MSAAVSLPITKYPITTRLTTDHRPRYRYRRDSRRCKPRGSTCKPRGTPAGSTSAVSRIQPTNQSSVNSWATRWRRCVHLRLFGYFWLFLVIFGNIRTVNQTESLVFCHSQVGGTSQAYDPGNNITCVLSVYINREKQFAFVEFRTVTEASNAMVSLF